MNPSEMGKEMGAVLYIWVVLRCGISRCIKEGAKVSKYWLEPLLRTYRLLKVD